ncbi:sulfotransferase domain-containing protein [Modestobacter sp. I12A-02662]|uniref:sulfotransferase domain-containing protein n=1 Tax=Modestobacter sp. I12A-02662 TaxID=1730496 RepID=UPI0034DF92A9
MSQFAATTPEEGISADLPTFLVIGAMKAGTTSLYHYLKNHEQVFMSRIKELDFFVTESNWSRGLDWYRQQFNGAGGALARGEASTLYTKFPEYAGVPERIASVLPHVKLVYVVRDPIERLRSHYQHRVKSGAEQAPPEVALLENPIYLATSRYGMQVERYLDHFPREQVLITTSERMRSDRSATVQQVYEFLGVDPDRIPPGLDKEFYRTAQRRSYPPIVWWARRLAKRHVPQAKRAKEVVDSLMTRRSAGTAQGVGVSEDGPDPDGAVLSPALRAQLADVLAEDVARLRRHMPEDFDGWGLA